MQAALWLPFLLGAHMAELPATLPPGTELRVVSPDLLTVYSSGRVEDGTLVIDLPLDVGTEVRLLVFAPDASDEELAAALSGAAALYGTVADDRGDVWLRVDGEAVSLRAWLAAEHGIELVMVTRRTR